MKTTPYRVDRFGRLHISRALRKRLGWLGREVHVTCEVIGDALIVRRDQPVCGICGYPTEPTHSLFIAQHGSYVCLPCATLIQIARPRWPADPSEAGEAPVASVAGGESHES